MELETTLGDIAANGQFKILFNGTNYIICFYEIDLIEDV